jgi:molecular chaperone DnaK (HSP70)
MATYGGIDLGTTYTKISYYDRDTERANPVDLYESADGQKILRSVVYFPGPGERPVIGDSAWKVRYEFPERVVVGIKRSFGSDFTLSIDGVDYTPQAISAEILKTVAREAEIFLGEGIKDVVVTVPTHYGIAELAATEEASKLAGLNVLGLLPEPHAVVLAYSIEKVIDIAGRYLLVFDLGGATFDLTLIQPITSNDTLIQANLKLETLCIDGNRFLGGYDWDRALAQVVADKVLAQFEVDIMLQPENEPILLDNCENARCDLSRINEVKITADALGHQVTVTRSEFELATADLLNITEVLLEEVLSDAEARHGITKHDIDVVLAGGSSKMPMVKQMVERVMGKPPFTHKNPELLVTMGAAYWAYLLQDKITFPGDQLPVLSRPIYLEDFDGYHEIAPERTPLPFRRQMTLMTSDTSGVICFGIREESDLLGDILMTDIPKNLPVGSKIEIDIVINEYFQILARALVPALGRETTAVLDIPIPVKKSRKELDAELQKLATQAEPLLARTRRLQDRLNETKYLIQSGAEVDKILDRLDEIKSLIRGLTPAHFQPLHSTFDARVNDARELLEQVISHKPIAAQEGFDKQIEMVCAQAEKAYMAQDLAAWKDTYNRLDSLCKRLEGLLPPFPLPDPTYLSLGLASSLAALERRARDEGKFEMYHSLFNLLATKLSQIDPKSPDAMSQIHDWFFSDYEVLRDRLDAPLSVYERLHPDARSEEGSQKLARISEEIRHKLDVPKASWSSYGIVSSEPSFGIMPSLPSAEPRRDFEAFVADVPARPERRPEVPTAVDRVHFSVTAPPMINPGSSFVVDLWAHLEQQRQEVIQRAREGVSGGEILVKTKGPLPVARGTVLTVHLAIDGLTIEDSEDTILWEGEIGNASFAVQVPQDAAPGGQLGKATIYADAVQIARVNFELTVALATDKPLPESKSLPVKEIHHRTAFASYASADRDEVLHCIHGMQKAAPSMEIFIDVHSLRSGQNWEKELWTHIPSSDIFFLFWSVNAKQSPWVEKEWRCALNARGLDFIDPVPLQPPEVAPPPPELSSLHFNDWQLAYLRNAPKPTITG